VGDTEYVFKHALTQEVAYNSVSLMKDCPEPRPVHPPTRGKVVAIPQVGGLHHRYERLAA
jgi:hypothetical protein